VKVIMAFVLLVMVPARSRDFFSLQRVTFVTNVDTGKILGCLFDEILS